MGTEAPDMLENNEYPNCRTMKGTGASELNSDRRERLIEKACKVAVAADSYCIEDTVKSLADAGMLKMPEDK